jgi:lysozyme family protein
MFETIFKRVVGHEGGFQRSYSDRGNWTGGFVGKGLLKGTNWGISAMSYPDEDIKGMPIERAYQIYKEDWWDKLNLDKFRKAMQYQLFDAAINHGMYNAARMLQRALGIKDDGIIGPITAKTARAHEENDLLMLFLAERLDFFTNVATWDDYGRGWARRLAGNLRIASEDN